MSRKRKGIITVDVEAEAEVECAEVIQECTTEDLVRELQRREDARDVVPSEALTRIWTQVMHHGQPLEDVVSDLMRERTWPWRTGGSS